MFKNYLHIALRNMQKKPLFAAISTAGLAIGITSFVFIALFVFDEISFDRHFSNSNRILLTYSAPGNIPWLKDVPEVAPAIASRVPEIQNYTRLFRSTGLVKTGKISFNETKIFFADTSFFKVFDLPFVEGSSALFGMDPNSVIITEVTKKRYFGNENATGKELHVAGNDGLSNFNLRVVGVIKDIQPNSHFHFDFLIPYRASLASRSNMGVYSYFLASKNTTPAALTEKLNHLKQRYFDEWRIEAKTVLGLQPITSIHLYSNYFDEIEPGVNVATIYIFSITAFLILFIACINYINISLAQSSKRAKEIGVRKILGAGKPQVIFQFITESFVHLVISIIIASVLLKLGIPFFNEITEKSLTLDNKQYLLLLSCVITALGLIAALYPAIVLSKFNPILALKNAIPVASLKISSFRKGLIVFQFTVAVVLLICTAVIFHQLSFVRNKSLGFAKEQVIVISLRNPEAQREYEVLKQELSKISNVLKVSASHSVPGDEMDGGIYRLKTSTAKQIETGSFGNNTLYVDEDYFDVMKIKHVSGRKFNKSNGNWDATNSVIINEAAVEKFGWESPDEAIGKTIECFVSKIRDFRPAQVVGVISNFHYQSLRSPIEPLVVRLASETANNESEYLSAITSLSIKIRGTEVRQTLAQLKRVWQKINVHYPFEYTFLDERLRKLYSSEEKLSYVFSYFSFIVLFITCIGLFGISLLAIELRTKEIGIRKVLGATVTSIVTMLSKDFLKLVLIATCIAFPVALWASNKWLQEFAYRIIISWWTLVSAALIAVLIALITISFHAIKAAIVNPAQSLRTE